MEASGYAAPRNAATSARSARSHGVAAAENDDLDGAQQFGSLDKAADMIQAHLTLYGAGVARRHHPVMAHDASQIAAMGQLDMKFPDGAGRLPGRDLMALARPLFQGLHDLGQLQVRRDRFREVAACRGIVIVKSSRRPRSWSRQP